METLSQLLKDQATQLGIAAVDVRIKRIDLPPDVSNSVFSRMKAERLRVAKDFRSRGGEAAERIRADADRQGTVIPAEAYRDAERQRGDGDAQAADSTPRLMARIRISTTSTVACQPTDRVSALRMMF